MIHWTYGPVPVMPKSQAKHPEQHFPLASRKLSFCPTTMTPLQQLCTHFPVTKSKILCFLWSHFSTQSSTMSTVLYSWVSQTHQVFLGYNLAVWEFGWSLEQVAYGGEANLSLLRADWTPIRQGYSLGMAGFVLRLCGDGPGQTHGREHACGLISWGKVWILVPSQSVVSMLYGC